MRFLIQYKNKLRLVCVNYPIPAEDSKKSVPCLQEAKCPGSDTRVVLALSWIPNASALRQHQRTQAGRQMGVSYLGSRGDLTGWAPCRVLTDTVRDSVFFTSII